jgi:hypothetical protein
MSYTTPRTANVGDTWTAAWYNGEVRDNIKWAHDLLISQGASFPASPLTGQRHLFVSGQTRLLFVYDGSHWISDEVARAEIPLVEQPTSGAMAAGVAATVPLGISFSIGQPAFSLRTYQLAVPTIDTTDTVKNNAMTLQGRLVGSVTRVTGTSGGISVGVGSASAAGGVFGADASVAASEATITDGLYTGSWADLVSGSVAGVQLTLWARSLTGSGTPGWTFVSNAVRLRYKL